MRLLGTVALPGVERSVPVARAYARDLLLPLQWPSIDEVELLISELVANAVQHSESGRRPGGLVRLAIAEDDDGLWVDVADEGSPDRVPRVQSFDLDGDGGRGLWLVDRMATAWGVREDREKRVVWFHVSCGSDLCSPQGSGGAHDGA
nr:ATP-binding protein [Microbispora rosea]